MRFLSNIYLVRKCLWLFYFSILLISSSCRKGPGLGGKAMVSGKLKVQHYDGTWTSLISEYYAPGEDVYIVYGNNQTFNDKVETHYDGTYEFNYLLPGHYEVYAYSKDSSSNSVSNKTAIIKEFIVLDVDRELILDDLIILDN